MNTSVVIITNNSNFTYYLTVPFYNFTWKSPIFGQRQQYSVNLPYNSAGSIQGVLTSSGPTLNFTISQNGELINADLGLTIQTIADNLYLVAGGLLPGVDTVNNNALVIN